MAQPYDSYTDFPNGVTSFGIPLFGSGNVRTAAMGRTWFVNANATTVTNGWAALGSDGYSGQSPTQPFLTMSKAFSVLDSGDVINFIGNVTEQLTTPVNVYDVTINGAATRPRHADSPGVSAATWKPPASPTAVTPLCTVLQQGWRFCNFLMDGPSDAASILLYRDGGAGDLERDASHFSAYNMKILNGSVGIQDSGGTGQHWIEGCEFFNNTTDINNVVGAGIGQPFLYANVVNCIFRAGTTAIDMPAQGMMIDRSLFAAAYTTKIDLSGGVGSNFVRNSTLGGTYSNGGGYTAGTSDDWAGNFNIAGITAANPAP